jgi:hypothetical protein
MISLLAIAILIVLALMGNLLDLNQMRIAPTANHAIIYGHPSARLNAVVIFITQSDITINKKKYINKPKTLHCSWMTAFLI